MSNKTTFLTKIFRKYLDISERPRYWYRSAQYSLGRFFKREILAINEAKNHINWGRKTDNMKNFLFYFLVSFFFAEAFRVAYYSVKFNESMIFQRNGSSFVGQFLYFDRIPIPDRTLLKMSENMIEYNLKGEQDLLT